MKKIKIGINGFGRIGRTLFRLIQNHPHLEVVAVNDLADTKTLAHLLKYDSIHGVYNGKVDYDINHIIVDGKGVRLFNIQDPKNLNWSSFGIDVVVECTGKFKTKETLEYHLKNGAKKVKIS